MKTLCRSVLMLALLMPVPMVFAGSLVLIKAEEAKLAPAAGMLATRGITRGPGVKLVSPNSSDTPVKAPFDLSVAFEPRGGAKIDLASLKVTYLKASPVDLLPRMRAGVTETGIMLSNAQVPPGEHHIQISVQDSEGRQTNTVVHLNVGQ